jgi:hypothetical protein
LDKGTLTRLNFVHEILDMQKSIRYQNTSAVQYLLTGNWPGREQGVFNAFLNGQKSVNGISQRASLVADTIPPRPTAKQRPTVPNSPSEWRKSSPSTEYSMPFESPTGGIEEGVINVAFNPTTVPNTPPGGGGGNNNNNNNQQTQGGWDQAGGFTSLGSVGLDRVTNYYFFNEEAFTHDSYNTDENLLVTDEFFKRKYYGVNPNEPQRFRLESLMRHPDLKEGPAAGGTEGHNYLYESVADEGRIDAVQALAIDNEISTYRGFSYTKGLEISRPPNTTMADMMKTHALWVSVVRKDAIPSELSALLQVGSLSDQINFVLAHPDYLKRFPPKLSEDAPFNHWAFGSGANGDWYTLNEFGIFTSPQITAGWIFHQGINPATDGLGWIYMPYEQKKTSIWFYKKGFGWCWTTLTPDVSVFPYFYSKDLGWLYLYEDIEAGKSWLYNVAKDEWRLI